MASAMEQEKPQVNESDSDSDSEYETEEYIVFADFKNQYLPKDLSSSSAVKIIGIETKNPRIEINGNVFKGTYDNAMGTICVFEKDSATHESDPIYDTECKQLYKYIAKTNKVINLQRVFLEKTDEAKQEEEEQIPLGEADRDLKLNITYEEAIQDFPALSLNK